MDMPVNVPIDDPNADTEWNDILRKHGVIPERPPSPTPVIEEALAEARRLAHENRLEGKDLDELAELEDEEDEAFLEEYRKKRLAELSAITKASVHNTVYHIQRPDYSNAITEASHSSFVLLLLTASESHNAESALAERLWRELAARFGEIKFCQMRAAMCIDGYRESNTPTVLVYKDGDVRRQLITLRDLGGLRTSMREFERLLTDLGAIRQGDVRLGKGDDERNHRDGSGRLREPGKGGSIRDSKAVVDDEDDSDWD